MSPRMLRLCALALAVAITVAPAAPSTAAANTSSTSPSSASNLTTPAFDPVRARRVVAHLADLVEAYYVDPPTAHRYAAELRTQLAAGRYDACRDDDDFGARVTADLRTVAVDRHLRLVTDAAAARRLVPQVTVPDATSDASPTPSNAMPPGTEAMEMIGAKHDIAYLRFNQFAQSPAQGDAARAFLLAHANARAVVIDGRPLRGGGFPTMDAMLPLFFGRATTLARLETRAAAAERYAEEPSPTLRPHPGTPDVERLDHIVQPDPHERRLRKVPLLYLTSNRTASAGEHFALVLRSTRRGVLIGETTAGAGHFGGFEPLGDGMTVFLPIGRTVDVRTGIGWEATGIAPDVAVPADDALRVALARLGEH